MTQLACEASLELSAERWPEFNQLPTFCQDLNMQRIARLTLTVIVTSFQWGCSTQAWYEAAKQNAENECAKQPPGAYEECRARINKQKFDAYEKARSDTKNQ